MKFGKVFLSIAVVLLVLVGIRFAISRANEPNDQQLIEQALQDSIEASKEGRPGGVMDKLSSSLRFNDMDTSGNRNQIANYIKNNKPDVEVMNKTAVVTGDEARIVSPVKIELNLLGQSLSRELKEVTLVFRKEEAMEYLVIPTRKWKLAEVQVPDASVYDFLQN